MTTDPDHSAGAASRDVPLLAAQASALMGPGEPLLASLANVAALLGAELRDVNWVGFYLLDSRSGILWLGPFAGAAACTRIVPGAGVCGTAVVQDRTLVVDDVHTFPGHIACDPASRSETVVPLRGVEGSVIGVLDVDSPLPARFTTALVASLEAVAVAVGERCTEAAIAALTQTL